jgi:hypothetical protein
MNRPWLIVLVAAASGAAYLAACNISDPTVTLECAAPDTGSYVSISGTSDTVRLHCFQKATP